MSKIKKIETIPLQSNVKEYLYKSRLEIPIDIRRGLLVKITTDDGYFGYGEGLCYVAPRVVERIIMDIFAPILVDMDPFNTEYIWNKLYGIMSMRGYSKGFQIVAISAIDIALWDLKGKILNQPVFNLLGGKNKHPIPVYASFGMYNMDEFLIKAEECVKKGFKGIKLKVGLGIKKDLECIKKLREFVGDEFKIMIDANGAYDASSAIQLARMADKYEIFWFEEPIKSEDMWGNADIARKSNTSIAAGEGEYTIYGFRELILNKTLNIVQPGLPRAGGFTGCKKIAALAESFNIYYAPFLPIGTLLRTATFHLATTLPNLLICEYSQESNKMRDELVSDNFEFKNGYIYLLDKPGIGIDIKESELDKYIMK